MELNQDMLDRAGAVGSVSPSPDHQVASAGNASVWDVDPLEPDAAGDGAVLTTRRRLLRLAISATEVGARFAREEPTLDPAVWMLSPRKMFGGRTAIDACQELEDFQRNILIHGLGLGLDADPEALDEFLEDEGSENARAGDGDAVAASLPWTLPRPRLLSCWLDFAVRDGGRLHAFCALVTDRPTDLVERIVGRYGHEAARDAHFAVGFDHTTPLATKMISDAMADTLALAAADPESPLSTGLDVVVERRFQA